ncbi:Histidine kinase 2, partial [Mucuna pruriens]
MGLGLKMKSPRHHPVALRLHEQTGSKGKYTFIQAHRAWLPKFLMLWILLMALIGWCIYSKMDADTKVRRKEVLGSLCDQRARMLQDQFSVSVNHVHALAILVSTFHYYRTPSAIDQETFAEYTARTAFERPLLSGVAYAQRVVNSERETFEKQHGWVIKTMEREPSQVRDEYAPVIFAQETVSYLESLDMMSGEEDRENILRARATGKAVLTSPFSLLGSHHLGVVLTFPVYKSKLPPKPTMEERIKATAGYVGGSFDVESLVENLLGQLAGNQAILVNVYDITNSTDPLIMYGNQNEEGDMSLVHESKLDFGDSYRKHKMICRRCLSSSFSTVGYILYGAGNHIVKVEDDFHAMEELKVRAESADIAKSQFLATVSHEIRTPMNGILGMLGLLLGTELSSTQLDYAQTAQACGKALIALINEVLDRAKIEAGKIELEAVPFDLRSILDDVLSLFSEKSRHKGLELAVFVSDKVPDIVRGDPGRFRQIVTNLVGNSVKVSENFKVNSSYVVCIYITHMDVVCWKCPSNFTVYNFFTWERMFESFKFISLLYPVAMYLLITLLIQILQFTERGHIIVIVQLAENRMSTMNGKIETFLNGGSDEVVHMSGGYNFKTLSGYEAADERNSWDNFKHLIADEEFLFDASVKKVACGESYEQVTLMVSVEDTGIGIPLSIQDKILMPFVQADSSTSRRYGGTGIGLSISKCLVELMGGEISFISRPQVGSTFSFTADFGPIKKNSITDMKKHNLEDLPSSFRGLKAIVVDGKPVRAAVTRYHLKRLGIQAKVANSINKAISLCGKNGSFTSGLFQADIIFIEKDSWVCGEDGMVNVWQLDRKQNGHMYKIPQMILLATNISNSEFDKAKAAGFSDTVIMKPLRASMVSACLQQVLGMGKDMKPNGSAFVRSRLSGKKILVVDDNVVNRRVAAGALKNFGAEVKCAESGKTALEMLKLPHNFDACFMDIQMPEMDGFEATRRIRMMESMANEVLKSKEYHLPILAMTADVIHATYDECKKCGMDGYVSKPFEEENLYQAVAKCFNPSSSD